jgi:hypothetical protein
VHEKVSQVDFGLNVEKGTSRIRTRSIEYSMGCSVKSVTAWGVLYIYLYST